MRLIKKRVYIEFLRFDESEKCLLFVSYAVVLWSSDIFTLAMDGWMGEWVGGMEVEEWERAKGEEKGEKNQTQAFKTFCDILAFIGAVSVKS